MESLHGFPAALTISESSIATMMFNGKDLSGLYSWLVDTQREDPRHVFGVTNGLIRISGDGLGYLATDQEFENYLLVVEFKWGQKNWPWGDRMTIKVNGTVVNEAFDVFPSRGKILLQCEGSEIFFRRFELHPLKAPVP